MKPLGLLSSVCIGLTLSIWMTAAQAQGAELLQQKCGTCHDADNRGLSRIRDVRKTPEGWDMTLVRMMLVHKVPLTAQERAALVKQLADTRGLAPAETEGWRYVLERRPNVIDRAPDETIAVMCARCHTYARTALQRRTLEDWTKHSHFHLGQYPTAEYQALGRDRNWWDIASSEVPQLLAAAYPLDTRAWREWQRRAPADLTGTWRVTGRQPGAGAYQGRMQARAAGDARYDISLELEYADGRTLTGQGEALVYTGFEWRARLTLGDAEVLQVLALDAAGTRLSGRWFQEDQDAIGGDLQAVREGAKSMILDIVPAYLRAGERARVSIHGIALDGTVDFGQGVRVARAVSRGRDTLVLEVESAVNARSGPRTVRVGDARAAGLFTVYRTIDSLRVEPAQAIARVGGGGGPLPPVPAQFDAVAYLNGSDGKPGTDDDVRIGVMPARWSVAPATDLAAALEDVRFAGTLSDGGLFMPAAAGPNPQRPYSTNNAGDLSVTATVDDGGNAITASAHLVVTVQRWNDPPIR